MSEKASVDAASMHPIVLLPCPFCGSDNWTQQTAHSTVKILTHHQGCWIGRSEQNQETWINPGSEFSAHWNRRAKQRCVCDARGGDVFMLKTKSALSYFGSDSEVAESLAEILHHCKHVTIPFCGGMSILPHLKARAIVANDLNDLAINFYRHASGAMGEECQQQLIERCELTLSHPSEMHDAQSRLMHPAWKGSWGQAWAYWAQCWIGRKGKGGTDSPATMPSVRRTASGGTNASRIRAAASDLHQWAKHFERCEWESVCFRDLLPKVEDNRECGVYCDPPWVGAGDAYLHTFTEQDHIDLANCLSRFKASTVVVRYGDHPLIRQYYNEMGWHIIEAESRDQCNFVKGEIWITNQRGD